MNAMAVHYSSAKQDWTTPYDLFLRLETVYRFDLDAAATWDNKLCDRYCKEGGGGRSVGDGLSYGWDNSRVWCNPPYGREIGKWVRKAVAEAKHATLIVMLVPARTDTVWWHHAVQTARVEFLKGRLKFGGAKSSAPFPSALLFWNC